jgi:hypothetical protein
MEEDINGKSQKKNTKKKKEMKKKKIKGLRDCSDLECGSCERERERERERENCGKWVRPRNAKNQRFFGT